jgi:hypothetical protein
MVSIPGCFSESYAEARAKFCRAAAEAGGSIRSWLNPNALGPNGELLYLDTARFGPADAPNMLVLISSTHGVEGHCGSGAQIAWLATGGPAKLPKIPGALIVHAINPYGFAWTRRVTEDNVDLNRNFVDHDKAYPKNDGYLAIADAILPQAWNEESKAATQRAFDSYAQKHGAFALQGAISSGQYSHPDGIFFGGAEARLEQPHNPPDRPRGARPRGPRRHHRLPHRAGAVRPRRADLRRAALRQILPAGARLVRRRDDLARERHLDLGDRGRHHDRRLPPGAARRRGHADRHRVRHLFRARVLGAVRADNWLHHRGDLKSPLARELKADMKERFFPAGDKWREMVWQRADQTIGWALKGLSG